MSHRVDSHRAEGRCYLPELSVSGEGQSGLPLRSFQQLQDSFILLFVSSFSFEEIHSIDKV